MNELELKYGLNPNQTPARLTRKGGGALPFQVLNGRPGYINFLDALNAWQLVRALREAAGAPAAASFKHVSPAGAAVGRPLDEAERRMYFVDPALDLSPLACAYVRARGADRLCSYGDWAALSDVCDEAAARCLQGEVSDGVIAPGYTPEALAILKTKKQGRYSIVQMDPDYVPAAQEQRDVFGVTFTQGRSDLEIGRGILANIVTRNKDLPETAAVDLLVALLTLKYTQSNSVCYVRNGQAIGVGAGQQSRIHCTRLAGDKADRWCLRRHPQVLDLPFRPDLGRAGRDNAIDCYLSDEEAPGLLAAWRDVFTVRPDPLTQEAKRAWIARTLRDTALGSDAFFPFPDNIERARRSGVRYIAQPGGSIRDELVIDCCDRYGMVMCCTRARLFHH
ncbi:MAG: phosphoribosylaminoimidazolecarboxamide formyltransferase [Oscillospiraceae bacterium]|nr:phosphoribosylaminoimidazolecarboxamide formyltransferase [Oscillospiraceae bacterium]